MKKAMSNTYYQDLARCVPLTRAEEVEMAAEMARLREERDQLVATLPQGDDKRARAHRRRLAKAERAFERVRNDFVCANLRLVVKIASQYGDGKLPLSDLIQEGNIGLMIGVDRFDHTRGFRFCTYGAWWIRHRVTRAMSNHGRAVRVPNHIAQTSSKLLRAMRKFEARSGRAASMEELSKITDIPVAKARLALQTTGHMLSIDATFGVDGRPLHETLSDSKTTSVENILRDERESDVNEALSGLKPLEEDILRKRFAFDANDPMTLRELGQLHSLSRERIRQIQNAAMTKMSRRLAVHAAQDEG
jgi:RNA polymerase primary sigma factor